MKKWDVFISHAFEDKQSIALPLAESLVRAGLRVWLDHFELSVGDSLREKIDEGLAESAFGVVVLSEQFLNKGWPKRELNGLFAIEEEGVKVILPVWHRIDKATVARYSPILADRLAADTKWGMPTVARAIAQAVLKEGTRLQSERITLASQFIEIVNQGPEPAKLSTFFATYPKVLPIALGHFGLFPDRAVYCARPDLGNLQPDLVVGNLTSTAGDWEWKHFFFCPGEGPFFDAGTPKGELKQAIRNFEHLQDWLSGHAAEAVNILLGSEKERLWGYGDRHGHEGVFLAGRRDSFSEKERQGIQSLKDRGIVVRSYDWLIEACMTAE